MAATSTNGIGSEAKAGAEDVKASPTEASIGTKETTEEPKVEPKVEVPAAPAEAPAAEAEEEAKDGADVTRHVDESTKVEKTY